MIEELKQENIMLAPPVGGVDARWIALWQRGRAWLQVLALLAVHTIVVFAGTAALKKAGVLSKTTLGALTAEVLIVTAATWFAWRGLQRKSWAQMGLRLNAVAVRDVLFGVFSMGVAQALLWGVLVGTGAAEVAFGALGGWQAYLKLIAEGAFLWALIAWSEEIWVRGYWLQEVAEGYHRLAAGQLAGLPSQPGAAGRLVGAIVSSVFFVLLHLQNGHFDWLAAVGIFLGGIFLALAYVCSDSLWLPIGMHFGWNFFEGTVFGLPVSGMGASSLLQTRLTGAAWFTGGAFGPEAGLAAVPVMLLALGMVAGYTSRRARAEHKKACVERLRDTFVNLFAMFGVMLG